MKFTAIALLVLATAVGAATIGSADATTPVHEDTIHARKLEPILYPGVEMENTDDGSPLEMVPASSVAVFPENEVVEELAITAVSMDNDDEALLPQMQFAMDQKLPKELAPDTGEDVTVFAEVEVVLESVEGGATSEGTDDTPNRPLPMQLAEATDDTPNRPLPMQLAGTNDDDTTELAAVTDDTPNRPLPMQLADTKDDDTTELAAVTDDTPNRPLPMQLADTKDDDDANLATTKDLPLPIEMDQAPLLLEIVDDGEIAKLANGDNDAVELPDDEEEFTFTVQDEMVEEIDMEEVGSRYLLRGTGDHRSSRSLASEQEEWLIAHNTRRTKLYADNDLGPADLVWSTGLQAKAESYVQILLKLNGCSAISGLDDWNGGQNLGGASSGRKGMVRTKEHVLQTWYDQKKDLPFPKNLHSTAVGWRATKYIGCASGKKNFGTGECFIDVCRYIKKGNCNVKADNFQAKMLADDSPCGPECPPEGCLAVDSNLKVTSDAKATPTPTKSPTQAATTMAPAKSAADSTAVAVVVPAEATEWLTAHNTRRTALYAANNLGPMDLKWSPKTAEAAKKYLDILLALDGCTIKHYLDDWKGGENLAAAWSSSTGYGRKNADAVKAWYEGEEKLGFGKNGHYTAVGWRATKYFGCANGKKNHGTGECFIEVCRYVKPGNCNIDADNWKAKMLADDSPCGPECPAEGCF